MDGMQIQQVASSVSAQTVATLMKAVASTTTGTMVSSVTLPTAPGASNTINFLPQQKLLAGNLKTNQCILNKNCDDLTTFVIWSDQMQPFEFL